MILQESWLRLGVNHFSTFLDLLRHSLQPVDGLSNQSFRYRGKPCLWHTSLIALLCGATHTSPTQFAAQHQGADAMLAARKKGKTNQQHQQSLSAKITGSWTYAAEGMPWFQGHIHGIISCKWVSGSYPPISKERGLCLNVQGVLLADGSERMDSMNLLRHMAPIAAILLLPVVMITEAGALNYIRAKSSTDGSESQLPQSLHLACPSWSVSLHIAWSRGNLHWLTKSLMAGTMNCGLCCRGHSSPCHKCKSCFPGKLEQFCDHQAYQRSHPSGREHNV